MVLSQSALSELLDAFRAGDGAELIRDAVRLVLQELIDAELTAAIGAAPARADRDPARTDRNGARSAAAVHAGRRRRAADPEAAGRVVLPGAARAAPSGRQGPVGAWS